MSDKQPVFRTLSSEERAGVGQGCLSCCILIFIFVAFMVGFVTRCNETYFPKEKPNVEDVKPQSGSGD